MALQLRKSDYAHFALGAVAFALIYPLNPALAGAVTGTTIGVARECRELRDNESTRQSLIGMGRDVLPYTFGGLFVGTIIALVTQIT